MTVINFVDVSFFLCEYGMQFRWTDRSIMRIENGSGSSVSAVVDDMKRTRWNAIVLKGFSFDADRN